MAYKSLYRAYRPQTFSEVVGQSHVTKTLQNAIRRNQLAHAYLFTGPRGTGKTSIAKLFARGINCIHPDKAPCNECDICRSMLHDNHPDIIEIDAASNNGVDDVRDLIERVKYAPIEAKYKVYIIDEVHMLSIGAFNALLKTLEEPPEHVVFILATTEIQKVLPTIISRCQRYDFSFVSVSEIVKRLKEVFEQEKIEYDEEVIEVIARLADGGMRDALTISEQVIAYGEFPIKVADVYDVYKICTPEQKLAIIEAILDKDLKTTFQLFSELESNSVDYKQLVVDIIEICKQSMIFSLTTNKESVPLRYLDAVISLSRRNKDNELLDIINEMLEIINQAKVNGNYRQYLEISAIRLTQTKALLIDEKPRLVDFNRKNKEISTPNEKPTRKVEQIEQRQSTIKNNEEQLQSTAELKPEVINNVEQLEIQIDDLLLKAMVIGDKNLRIKENELLSSLVKYKNVMKYKRITRNVNNTQLAVSSDYLNVFVTNTKQLADNLNTPESIEVAKELFDLIFEANKSYFFVSKEVFDNTVEVFMKDHNENKLPNKELVNQELKKLIKTTNEITIKKPEQLIEELFGEFIVEE